MSRGDAAHVQSWKSSNDDDGGFPDPVTATYESHSSDIDVRNDLLDTTQTELHDTHHAEPNDAHKFATLGCFWLFHP